MSEGAPDHEQRGCLYISLAAAGGDGERAARLCEWARAELFSQISKYHWIFCFKYEKMYANDIILSKELMK